MWKKSSSINLVKKDNNQLANQVINWALTVGRLMVIIVEIIALSAFIYRFYLDNQLRDINAKIQQDQAVLSSQKQKEEEYRNLQDRLNLESLIINQGKQQLNTFKEIISLTPQGITYSNFSLIGNQLNIQLDTSSVFPLSALVDQLRKYPQTDFISINTIENRSSSSLISVGITVNLKNKGGAINGGN